MSNREIRVFFIAIAQVVTMQVILNIMPSVVETTMTSRLSDLVRMNPLIYLGSKVNEYPQDFLQGVYKVLSVVYIMEEGRVGFVQIEIFFSNMIHTMEG